MVPNTAAVCRAFRTLWDTPDGFALVANLSQPLVRLEPGDLVAAAVAATVEPLEVAAGAGGALPLAAVAPPRAAPAARADDGRALELPQVAHVCVDRPELSKMLHCEFPPERYYDALAKDMQARHPRASSHMLEHCGVVESFLDLCIVSGFALGAAKTKGRIAQVEFEWLGSVCGRTGM